jgi:hypothetical protein
LITMSHCAATSCRRTRIASRSRLFARFRITAFPKARGTVKPSLGPSSSPRGMRRQNAAKYGPAIRLPWLYALRKSEVRRIRALFGKPKLVGRPHSSLVANCEFMAAFGPAPRQHRPSIFGTHAYPKPVRFCPFAIVWLKCTFWHLISSARGKRPESSKSKSQYSKASWALRATLKSVLRCERELRVSRLTVPRSHAIQPH